MAMKWPFSRPLPEARVRVQVQAAGFDAGELIKRLYGNNPGVGAVACLIGYLRDFNQGQPISAMYLEHYPGMTEKALQRIAEQAVSYTHLTLPTICSV